MPICDELSVSDLAWAAGFIDGDGVISLYKRSDRQGETVIVVRAMNTNRSALDKLQAMFGGTIHVMTKPTVPQNWKPSFYWSVSHKSAADAIEHLLPCLLLKRPQAELALEARSYVGSVGRQMGDQCKQALTALIQRCRVLNAKGRTATT